MRKILTLTLSLFIGLGLIVAEAEAKRFGGGKSFGMKRPAYSQPKRQQAPTNNTAQRQQAAGGAAQSGASRWLGPLAGLAAGGLLAAMLFGDAFDGFQPMDLLLLLGAAAAIFFFMKKMRGQQAPRPAHAAGGQFRAGRPESDDAAQNPTQGGPSFEAPAIGGGLRGEPMGSTGGFDAADADDGAPLSTPAWFDEERFLHQAKVHFVRLQAAWDSGDMKEIREFTTPELFAELTLEHHTVGDDNFTEVVEVEATLAGFSEQEGQSVASVTFRGLIREERGATANPFEESWHIVRDGGDADAEWFVAGIEQGE